MSERPKSSAASSKENYNHQELSNEMEKLNSQFEEMKEALICLNGITICALKCRL